MKNDNSWKLDALLKTDPVNTERLSALFGIPAPVPYGFPLIVVSQLQATGEAHKILTGAVLLLVLQFKLKTFSITKNILEEISKPNVWPQAKADITDQVYSDFWSYFTSLNTIFKHVEVNQSEQQGVFEAVDPSILEYFKLATLLDEPSLKSKLLN